MSALLLGWEKNPAVKHMLCAYVSRTGVTCTGIRSHSSGEITFDVELAPEAPGKPSKPGLYTFHFDPATGQPQRAILEPGE